MIEQNKFPMSFLISMVHNILINAHLFKWELWRTGMLRLDIDENTVLHIWDMRYRDENVTLIHDHPFNLSSIVIAGKILNQRYWQYSPDARFARDRPELHFKQQRIVCGAAGCVLSEPTALVLQTAPVEIITAGQSYNQEHFVVHKTDAADGTVTLVRRIFPTNVDRYSANVYVAGDKEWGDAKPREATTEEVADICLRSLAKWFS